MIQLDDGMYTDNSARLTNFIIDRAIPLFSPEDVKQNTGVEMQVSAPRFEQKIVADVGRPITKQILEAIKTARILVPLNSGMIDTFILEELLSSTEKKILFEDFGPVQLSSGRWVFVNNELSDVSDEYAVALAPAIVNTQLVGFHESTRVSIVNVIKEIEAHKNTVWPTFCYTLMSPLRTSILKIGLATFPVLYVFGHQNYGKTTLITEFCLLYDDKETGYIQGKFEANSTEKGLIQEISRFSNRVVLIDDLPISSDPSISRERLNLIEKMIRFAANNNVRRTASSQIPVQVCRCGIAISSEVRLRSASEISRVIAVNVDSPIIGTFCANRIDAANTFRAWIRWLMPHFDEEIGNLKTKLSDSKGGETARLDASLILLDWVNELLFRFALESEIISKEYYDSAIKIGHQQFALLLKTQAQEIHQMQNNSPKGNLCWYIMKGYNEGEFQIIKSRKKMSDEHDCIVENDALCIRTKTLLRYFKTKEIFGSLSDKQLTKTLQEEGVIDDLSSEKSWGKRNKEHKSAGKRSTGDDT